MSHYSSTSKWVLVSLTTLLIIGCASRRTPEMTPESNPNQMSPIRSDSELAQDQIHKLQERIQDLETRLSALNDKINLENGGKEAIKEPSAPTKDTPLTSEPVKTPPAHATLVPIKKPGASAHDSTSFVSDEAIDRFREAKILFDTKRYSDSIIEFSEFLKNETDHTLAPAAQYYLGMSYFNQKEYKLAEEELNRGLLAYPHSGYVPDTLLSLVQVSTLLKKPEKANLYKSKMERHFANSPQAKKLLFTESPSETASAALAPMKESTAEPSIIEKPQAPTTPRMSEESHE